MNRICTISLLLLLLGHSNNTSAQGIITTIAGNGITQYIGDGYPATNYSLAIPSGICMDKKGNLYIANRRDHRVRRLSHDSLFTIAGNGTPAYTGDGGPAADAKLDQPIDMCTDTAGNIYITEFYNDVVRKINAATGTITTICGSGTGGYGGDSIPAVHARMETPGGSCLDAQGNIYIADFGNHRIRKVTIADGLIHTVAGNGSAGFSGDGGPATAAEIAYPTSVTTDSAGNLYICDNGNNAIRKVDAATGIITTYAGTTWRGYSGDGGPAFAATLNTPLYVHADRAGNILIVDAGNNMIREVTTTGYIYTVAGTGAVGNSGDGGPARAAEFYHLTAVTTDDAGNMYIADGGNSVIRKVTPGYLAASAAIRQPVQISVFPNPSAGNCTIMLPQTGSGMQLAAYSVTGEKVAELTVQPGTNQVDFSLLPNGLYLLHFVSVEGAFVLRHCISH
jgi:sugar lactone lactonase YvrE